jgi:hypothetical protein
MVPNPENNTPIAQSMQTSIAPSAEEHK